MSMLDLVLSEEERVPCIFTVDVADLGFLDTSTNFHHQQAGGTRTQQQNLSAGSKVELPLWLARDLSRQNIVSIQLPKHYEKRMRDNIAASATGLNLKEFSPYYFEVGMVIANEKKDSDLKDTLRVAFSGDRFPDLLVNSLYSSNEDTAEFSNKLTSKEYEIYYAGVSAAREIENWRKHRLSVIKKSSLLGRRSHPDSGSTAEGFVSNKKK